MIVKTNNLNLINGEYYPLNLVNSNSAPLIGFNYCPNKNYTTIIVDLDASGSKYYLHLLQINNNLPIKNYVPPAPPKCSGIHRYQILICEQIKMLNSCNYIEITRSTFNPKKFIKQNKLIVVDEFIFKTSYSLLS